MRGVPSSTPPLPPNTKHVKDARIPLPTAWRRRLQCCSLTRANGGVLSRVPSQGLRKKAPGPSDLSILCFCVKDDDCGTLAESAAPPAAGRESVTSKQSGGLRGSRSGPVYNLERRRAVAEKMQSSSAVIRTAIIMILPAGVLTKCPLRYVPDCVVEPGRAHPNQSSARSPPGLFPRGH